jgi:hypothetical protein
MMLCGEPYKDLIKVGQQRKSGAHPLGKAVAVNRSQRTRARRGLERVRQLRTRRLIWIRAIGGCVWLNVKSDGAGFMGILCRDATNPLANLSLAGDFLREPAAALDGSWQPSNR